MEPSDSVTGQRMWWSNLSMTSRESSEEGSQLEKLEPPLLSKDFKKFLLTMRAIRKVNELPFSCAMFLSMV